VEAKKQLRKPEDWPSFENLCKKLWGEIWECPEITKNGRSGQQQDGVDVSGIPKDKSAYYGVQCKGKDEYTHKKLTQKEIDLEIKLAKAFKPALEKFYIATTANKDAKIEQYVRERNIENREAGLFDIALFSWEDIVDLIDENKETHDWYLGLNKYKVRSDVEVKFENEEAVYEEKVSFCEKHVHYNHRLFPNPGWLFTPSLSNPKIGKALITRRSLSYSRIRLKVSNVGNASIENPKLLIRLKGVYSDLQNGDFESLFITHYSNTDVKIRGGACEITIFPKQGIIVPGDTYLTGIICVKPKLEGSEIDLEWTFLSNTLKKEGHIHWKIDTEIIRQDVDTLISPEGEERVEVEIMDLFEEDV
jgi:hypothetical protein